jgi:hypothetical protein
MQTTQASEPFNANSGPLEVRQHDPAGVSDDNVFDVATSVDQDPDLAIYFPRNLGQMSREFLAHNFVRMNAPLIEFLKAVDLAWL